MESLFHRFQEAYGSASILHQTSPTLAGETVLDCLIATLLTQATNDRYALKAFLALKEKYPKWESVMGLSEETLAAIVRPAGLGREKARNILGILKAIHSNGSLSLEPLHSMASEAVRAYLLSLPGVGPKTAACVQAFSLNQPAFPVDTHVHRILKRWGFISAKTTPQQAQKTMEETIPKAIQSDFHVYLIHHGRTVCQASKPRCEECILKKECPRLGE